MSDESWTIVLQLTREMVRLAQEQEWEELAEYEARRSQLLESIPAVDATTSSTTIATMREVLDLDRELIDLCRKAQDEVATALQRIAAGRRSDAAYTKNR